MQATWSRYAICTLLLHLTATAGADILELEDGRRYEGKITSQGDRVRIDTMIGRARCTLGFPSAQVKRMETKALPQGFFEPAPAAERVSDPARFKPDQPLYIEVPVVGRIGEAVFSDAIADVLSYAKRNKIAHVVFDVDSPGGDFDEAVEIYDLLKRSRGPVKYHVVARRCLGPALVFPFWASTVHLLPGGKMGPAIEGGSSEDKAVVKKGSEEIEMTRAQIAYKVITETGRTGLGGEILRAMVDPDHTLYVWKGEGGRIEHDSEPPKGVPADQLIIGVDRGATLVLTHAQGKALGMKDLEGGPAGLGKLLGLEGWEKESDYGAKTVERISTARRKSDEAKQSKHDTDVRKVQSRRETTQSFISHSLKEAASWDPTKGNYETYSIRYDWGWGWSSDYADKKYTVESQKKWKTRTDACMYYISSAAKGLKQMKGLEEKAVKLGLDPIYSPNEIDTMLNDLNVKYKVLGTHRDTLGK
jgi:hypothetical protein